MLRTAEVIIVEISLAVDVVIEIQIGIGIGIELILKRLIAVIVFPLAPPLKQWVMWWP